MKENKVQQTETREIKRSQIEFASYNPRKISDEARKQLKANIKRLGLFGGIVWNETTGRLVSGHQRMSVIDEINRYDPQNPDSDYLIKVEVTNLDDKTEKEQNIFMNNKAVQGDFDLEELASIVADIDYEQAGLGKFDLEMMGIRFEEAEKIEQETFTAWNKEETLASNEELARIDEETKQAPENTRIDRSVAFANDTAENQIARHNEMQKIKDRIKNSDTSTEDYGIFATVAINFKSEENRVLCMASLGYDQETRFVDGEEFFHRIEYGLDDE